MRSEYTVNWRICKNPIRPWIWHCYVMVVNIGHLERSELGKMWTLEEACSCSLAGKNPMKIYEEDWKHSKFIGIEVYCPFWDDMFRSS